MRIGSLFSGIGGLDVGLEAAIPDAHTVWQIEQSAFCRRILGRHWPHADRRVTDVRMAHRSYAVPGVGPVTAGRLAPIDLLAGGFPCQGVSLAGKGLGLADDRSGLWYQQLRLVRELEPTWVVIENVAALRARGLDAVLWGLAEAGYDAEWSTFGAVDVGAPHRRKRIAIIAYAQRQQLRVEPGGSIGEGGPGSSLVAEHGEQGAVAHAGRRRREALRPAVADAERPRLEVGQGDEVSEDARRQAQTDLRPAAIRACRAGASNWAAEPDVGRVADGVPRRMDRLRALGNAVVPQWAYQIGLRIQQHRSIV